MAVVFDSGTGNQDVGAATSHSFSHTCTGSNLVLIVGVHLDTIDDQTTSVTYNSVSMTLEAEESGTYNTSMHRLAGPATGANTVAVSWAGSFFSAHGAMSFTGVNQSDPTGAVQQISGNGSSVTDDVTDSATDDMVVAVVSVNNITANITEGANQTERYESLGPFGDRISGAGSSEPGGSGTITMSHSWTGNQLHAQVSINLNQVAANRDLMMFLLK